MPKQPKSAKKQAVLIVEDSIDFSNLLKFVVEDDGFEGIQFPVEGQDILEWARKYKPAVILMDLALRRKDGMEFIEDLKADPATKNIPIVIITGRDLTHRDILGLQVRGVKYLRKGRVEMEEIRQEIRNSVQPKASRSAVKPKE